MSTTPFIDRRGELGILEEEWARPGFRLIVVYGRRRLGKTRLLLEWLRNRRGVFYEAAELSYPQLSEEFSRSVGRQLGIYVTGGDIVEAVEELASVGERIAVVIDEFQYIVDADPSLPSRLTRSIDGTLAGSRLVLVISGSAVSFFEKELLGYRAPLHGRRTAQVKLRPMRLLEAWGFWPSMNPVEALEAYTVVGGTPAYLAPTYGAKSTREVLREVLRPGSPLLEEALLLLRQELREPRSYAAILKAVAEGATRPAEAAQKAGLDVRSIHRYIEVLEEMDIVEKRRPLGYRRGTRIYIRDPYFLFYFNTATWARSLVERGLVEEAVEETAKTVRRLAPLVFEQWLREHVVDLYSAGIIPVKPVETGPWWHRGEEIDLVVREPGRKTCFIEAKWATTGLGDAKRLLQGLEAKASKTGLQGPENCYAVVAKNTGTGAPVYRLDEARLLIDYSKAMTLLRTGKGKTVGLRD